MDITKGFNDINKHYNRPLVETDNFKVIPSIGSLIEGWVLMVPKKHYISFSEMKKPLLDEANSLSNELIQLLKNKYNNDIISFENGSTFLGCKNGCGVDYAHIHFLPLDLDIKYLVDIEYSNNLKWEQISSLSEIPNFNSAPYFYININGFLQISNVPYSTSQLIRKGIAKHLCIPNKFNWKEYKFINNVNKTISRFSAKTI